jgi:hypothetical protein
MRSHWSLCVSVYPPNVASQRPVEVPLPLLGNGKVKFRLSLLGIGWLEKLPR